MIRWGTASDESGTEISENEEKLDTQYAEMVEEKISEFLKTVDGIEVANVFVTVDGGYENEYARKGGGGSNISDYLVTNSGNGTKAAIVRTVYPRIRGVAISCTGGENPRVKEQIVSLISAGLGIGANKIDVVGS